jgi:hypothetical protein
MAEQEKKSTLRRAARKLPVVSQIKDDEHMKNTQTKWFATQHPNSFIDEEPTVVEYFKSIRPTRHDAFVYLTDTFPFLKWIWNYNMQWFLGDLIAGVTVGAVVIPQVSDSS